MALLQLRLETLKDLDFGRPAVAFEQGLADAVRDCIDRAHDNRARKVTLEMVLIPVIEDDGDCNQVEGEFKIKTVLPHRQTKPYSFGLNRQGRLFFSENAPDNVNQTTFEDVNPDTGRVERGDPDEV
jgi:hypothetical protein